MHRQIAHEQPIGAAERREQGRIGERANLHLGPHSRHGGHLDAQRLHRRRLQLQPVPVLVVSGEICAAHRLPGLQRRGIDCAIVGLQLLIRLGFRAQHGQLVVLGPHARYLEEACFQAGQCGYDARVVAADVHPQQSVAVAIVCL